MNIVTHKQRIEGNQDNARKINGDTHDSNPNNYKIDRKSRTVYPPVRNMAKRTAPQRDVMLEPMQ